MISVSSAPGNNVESTCGRLVTDSSRMHGVSVATMHRFRLRGILDSNKIRRKLVMTRAGGRWRVRDEDVAAFFAAIGGEAGGATPPTVAAASSRSAERAARELDAAGICD